MLQGHKTPTTNHCVQATDERKVWAWLSVSAIGALYNVRDYTNSLTLRKDRQFASDTVNVRLGAVRLRQVRVKPGRSKSSSLATERSKLASPPSQVWLVR